MILKPMFFSFSFVYAKDQMEDVGLFLDFRSYFSQQERLFGGGIIAPENHSLRCSISLHE